MDGDECIDGWVGGHKAVLRVDYSNKKQEHLHICCSLRIINKKMSHNTAKCQTVRTSFEQSTWVTLASQHFSDLFFITHSKEVPGKWGSAIRPLFMHPF